MALHAVLTPEDGAVARVKYRVEHGEHSVPETKIRDRYRRLWELMARSKEVATRTTCYDKSVAASAFRVVAIFDHGVQFGQVDWPSWTPAELR